MSAKAGIGVFARVKRAAALARGAAYMKDGRRKEAIEQYLRALDCDSNCYLALANLGLLYAQQEDHAEAIRFYNQALLIRSDNEYLHFFKGFSLQKLGKPAEACASFRRAIARGYAQDDIYEYMGLAYTTLLEFDEAVRVFGEVPPERASFALCFFKGCALYELERYDEAIASFDMVIERDPEYAEGWFRKGNACYEAGYLEQAIGCYDRAFALDPSDALVCNNKGVALEMLGRYEEALACYETAIETNTTDALAYRNAGDALTKLGRLRQAQAYYRMADRVERGR